MVIYTHPWQISAAAVACPLAAYFVSKREQKTLLSRLPPSLRNGHIVSKSQEARSTNNDTKNIATANFSNESIFIFRAIRYEYTDPTQQ